MFYFSPIFICGNIAAGFVLVVWLWPLMWPIFLVFKGFEDKNAFDWIGFFKPAACFYDTGKNFMANGLKRIFSFKVDWYKKVKGITFSPITKLHARVPKPKVKKEQIVWHQHSISFFTGVLGFVQKAGLKSSLNEINGIGMFQCFMVFDICSLNLFARRTRLTTFRFYMPS